MNSQNKAKLYLKYPLSSLFVYNGSTIAHYILGGTGIILGYHSSGWAGYFFGIAYLLFSFIEMYVLMPLNVCPHCVYYAAAGSRCISGLNILSRKLAKQGNMDNFPNRAKGILCPNNLYLASLLIPLIALIPALIVHYSVLLVSIFLLLLALLLFRFFILFPKIACLHCCAKMTCPQADAMGVRDL